jgi:hypothetical protein
MMVWVSADGVWRVEVRERAGQLAYQISQYGGLRRGGHLYAARAYDELNTVLAELTAPALEEMEQR